MPKLMNQLVTTSLSEVTVSTGASGGGGFSTNLVLEATGISSTTNWDGLSYSNVTTNAGIFTQGITTSTVTGDDAGSSSTVQYEIAEDGVYAIEFCSYSSSSGYQMISLHPGGGVSTESFCRLGADRYRSAFAIKELSAGDVLKFYVFYGLPIGNFPKIKITKLG